MYHCGYVFLDLIDCGIAPSVPFGDVNYTSTISSSLAVTTCRTGYELLGDRNFTCNRQGVWEGTTSCREFLVLQLTCNHSVLLCFPMLKIF